MTTIINDHHLEGYQLCAVVEHHGANMTSGHYTCTRPSGIEWTTFDDDRVTQSANSPTNSYLAFYRRTGMETVGPAKLV